MGETVYRVKSIGSAGQPFAVNQDMLKRYTPPAAEDPYFVTEEEGTETHYEHLLHQDHQVTAPDERDPEASDEGEAVWEAEPEANKEFDDAPPSQPLQPTDRGLKG